MVPITKTTPTTVVAISPLVIPASLNIAVLYSKIYSKKISELIIGKTGHATQLESAGMPPQEGSSS